MFGAFQSLDQAVLHRIGGGHKPGGALGFVQSLVVQAVDQEKPGAADNRGGFGARRQENRVGLGHPTPLMPLRPVPRYVLQQLTAPGDVEELHSSTDGQHRHVPVQRKVQETQIQIVQRATNL